MADALTGTVHGKLIALDTALPALDGRRVRVSIEPLGGPQQGLSAEEQASLWREWRERGPQGPIDDGGDGFP